MNRFFSVTGVLAAALSMSFPVLADDLCPDIPGIQETYPENALDYKICDFSKCQWKDTMAAPRKGQSCALANEGVWCWNPFDDVPQAKKLTLPSGEALSNVIKIDAGMDHSCALQKNGRIFCWGDNSFAQLGTGNTGPVAGLVSVKGIIALDIAAGRQFTCAVLKDQTVACWGNFALGQLGNGQGSPYNTNTMIQAEPAPQKVLGVTAAAAIYANNNNACAELENNQWMCWGNNDHHQLNESSSYFISTPVIISQPSPEKISHLAFGDLHACALTLSGKVYCRGYNYFGQVGTTASMGGGDIKSWTEVGLVGPAVALATTYSTCAVLQDKSLWCWGNKGDFGEKVEPAAPPANATIQGTGIPLKIADSKPIFDLFASAGSGSSYFCALGASRTIQCFGSKGIKGDDGSPPLKSAPPVCRE